MRVFKNIRQIIFLLILSSFNLILCAEDLQKFSVQNNDTVIAIVSEKELSRFVFEQDKIKQIFAISGELYYEIEGENLYIKPSIQKPVNFFVSTEKGNTYKIIATPKDIPATQISITGRGSNKLSQARQSVTGESVYGESIYREKISKIIKVIKAEDETVGYKVKQIGKTYREKNGLKGYFDSKWWNDEVVAEKHFLFNVLDQSLKIDKQYYLKDQDAVYIDRSVIEPGKSAMLIKVRVL
jgi:hypothetical protein